MANKTPNHELSDMRCPVSLEDVDLFGPGAQEHWYEAYSILHREAPVRVLPGEGHFFLASEVLGGSPLARERLAPMVLRFLRGTGSE